MADPDAPPFDLLARVREKEREILTAKDAGKVLLSEVLAAYLEAPDTLPPRVREAAARVVEA